MYKQFVKNMDYFMTLNESNDKAKNYRYDLVKELDVLKDIDLFKLLKTKDLSRHKKVSMIIWSIKENSHRYPSFKALSWELWGYGFDGEYHEVNQEELEEQLKLVDLLLSTQYWH